MAISVVCPSCKKRFSVHDKFAGKKGPCPKCKAIIQVPEKTEEVVVHVPDAFGPKGTTGRAVLKPVARADTKVSPVLTAIVIVASLAVLITAWLLRSPKGDVSWLVLTVGALGLAPPLVWGGYAFLRDDELEAYRGRELLLRACICGLVYATVWGVAAWAVPSHSPPGLPTGGNQPNKQAREAKVTPLPAHQAGGQGSGGQGSGGQRSGPKPRKITAETIAIALGMIAVMVGIGAFGAFATLELDFGKCVLHYGLYFAVTVLLRWIMYLDPVLLPV
ncbi:MAG: hypothetical protein NTY19_33550 [Planctomycetota bacterium]|nr:hypothetical protein [Planctomycetota bacterium]